MEKTPEEYESLAKDIFEAMKMARQVEFLTIEEETRYASVLFDAMQWGKKKDKENKEYYKRNRLVEKYR